MLQPEANLANLSPKQEVSAHSTDQDIEWDADEGSDEHQDYDANYFNNGDDDDDSGAGEGEGEFRFLRLMGSCVGVS